MRTAILGGLFALGQIAFGQAAFEAASVRPVPDIGYPGGGITRGGPGTADPERLTSQHTTLKLLVAHAYGVQDYQVSGPDWTGSLRFDITAKIPAGSNQEQTKAMLQNLLAERFKLKLHRETKVFAVYELSVDKNGSKLRVSPDDAKPLAAGDYAEMKYVNGIPQFPPGSIAGPMMGGGGGPDVMIAAAHQPISVLTKFLQSRLMLAPGEVKPVIDKTGLAGNYDFGLKFAPPIAFVSANPLNGPSDPSTDVFTALRQDLGLRLEEKKDPLDVLVIDSAEKVPEAN
jgi:uncharacterized protein (TIGR03435 family)